MNTVTCPLAEAYIRSVNDADAPAYLALFAENALVDDAGREFRGRDAIAAWSTSDIFATNVRFELTDSKEEHGDAVLTTVVDGDFDRTGLPDPVVIVHRIAVENGKIARLTCRLAD